MERGTVPRSTSGKRLSLGTFYAHALVCIIGTAASTVFRLMCDDKVRMQMEAREDFYRIMDSYKEELEEQRSKIEEQSTKIKEQSRDLAAANNQIKEKDRLIAELQAALSKMK